jgi:hypothetical protein
MFSAGAFAPIEYSPLFPFGFLFDGTPLGRVIGRPSHILRFDTTNCL